MAAALAPVLAFVKRFPLWTAVGVFALVGFLFRDQLSGSVGDLRVGDCFDVAVNAAEGTKIKDVQHHPCTDNHVAEMILITNMTGSNDAYPGTSAMDQFVASNCVPAYKTYTGRDFMTDQTYEMSYLRPTTDGWKRGDRTIKCYVFRGDGKAFVGSIRAH